jgi:predicted RNA-binding protein with PUA-like domain
VWIVERRPDRGFAIVGSGNLSGGGLLDNIECSLYTDDNRVLFRLKRWFDALFYDERSSSVASSLIKKYEPFHQMAKQHRGEADRAGRRFKDKVGELRRSQLNEALGEVRRTDSPFFYVNTNIKYSKEAHQRMLDRGEACAFYGAKELICKIPTGAVVFLYASSKSCPEVEGRAGIVAFGKATGKVMVRSSYDGKPREAHCKRLEGFRQLDRSIKAPEIREISRELRGFEIAFNGTSNKIDPKLGKKLYEIAWRRSSL